MARQRRTLDDQIAELVTRGRTGRFNSLGTEGLAPIGSDLIEEGAIDFGHIKEGAVNPIALSPEVRKTFDDLETGLRENQDLQRETKERIKEVKEVILPGLDNTLAEARKNIAALDNRLSPLDTALALLADDQLVLSDDILELRDKTMPALRVDLAEARKRVEAVNDRISPIDAGMAILANQQITVSAGITDLKEKALPALRTDLSAAQGRLDAADVLLTDSFPKRIAAAEGSASTAATRATAAETAAKAAAADLVTAKTRADSAASAATTANAAAAAAEASSVRATGAAGVAETAADTARQQAIAALEQATTAGTTVTAAQTAARNAQTAADTAKAQATTAGTSAAAADAKAAQAAADAAKAAADALVAQQQATKSAGEATTAKSEAAAAKVATVAAEAAAKTATTNATNAAADAKAASAKAAAAETSATAATGAAGVAETAADTARRNAESALAQAQNSGSNATAAQAAADAAKAQATTAQSQATKAGTAASAADAAAATAAAKAAQAAADLIVARNAAADARGDADTALARADDAISAAGSAARVLYSTGNPSGTARVGDTWRKTNGDAGDIIGEWRYTKVGTAAASWKPQAITTEMISNLDVGKLTAGSGTFIKLVAEKMAAATATFQTVDVGNLTVTGATKMDTLVAERVGAAVGDFIHIDIGTGTFGEMDGDRIKVGTVQAQHMLVGSFGNLIPNGAGEYGKAGAWSENLTWDSTDKPAGENGSFKSAAGSGTVTAKGVWFEVEPNAEYKFDMWIKANKANSMFFLEMRDQAGSHGTVATAIPDVPSGANSGYPVGSYKVPTVWTKITSILKTTATASKLRIGGLYFNHSSGTEQTATVSLAGLRMVRRNDGKLIVNGSIAADQIDAKSVAAEVGTFIKLDVGNLTVTDKTKLNEVVAESIAAETAKFVRLDIGTGTYGELSGGRIAANTVTADKIIVGVGGNTFPDPEMLDPGSWSNTAGITWGATGTGKLGRGSVLIPATSAQTGVYYSISGTGASLRRPSALPGQQYYVSAWVRGSAAIPVNGVGIYARFYSSTGAALWGKPSNYNNKEATAANTWVEIGGIVEAPEDAVSMTIGVFCQTLYSGSARFSDPSIRVAAGGHLVVNGSITGDHVDAESVGAKVGTFVKLDAGNLTVTEKTNLNEAFMKKLTTEAATIINLGVDRLVVTGNTNLQTVTADKIFANLFATRKLQANQVIVGHPGNSMPDPMHNEPTMVEARNKNSTCTVSLSSSNDLALVATGTAYFRPLGVPQTVAGAESWVAVQPGEVWKWDMAITSNRVAGSMKFVGRTKDGSAYANPTATRTVPVGTGSYSVTATIPADCYWICPELTIGAGTQWIQRGSMSMTRVIDPSIIVDGLMDAKRIVGASIETVSEANQGIKLTARNGIQVFNSDGAEMLRANTSGVDARGSFESIAQYGRVEMNASIPGAAVATRYNAGTRYFGASKLNGAIYTGYGISGLVIDGPDTLTGMDLLDSGVNLHGRNVDISTAGTMVLKGTKGIRVNYGGTAIPERRLPLGILSYWESTTLMTLKTNTQIWAKTITVPADAMIRVTVHMRGYPTVANQVTMIYAQAGGVTFGAHYMATNVATYGADDTMVFHYENSATADKAVAFKVACTVAVPTTASWVIPAKTAEPQTEITVEDLGSIP